mgnify:CR=1 FL=1
MLWTPSPEFHGLITSVRVNSFSIRERPLQRAPNEYEGVRRQAVALDPKHKYDRQRRRGLMCSSAVSSARQARFNSHLTRTVDGL